jgi:hypothetical protein
LDMALAAPGAPWLAQNHSSDNGLACTSCNQWREPLEPLGDCCLCSRYVVSRNQSQGARSPQLADELLAASVRFVVILWRSVSWKIVTQFFVGKKAGAEADNFSADSANVLNARRFWVRRLILSMEEINYVFWNVLRFQSLCVLLLC